MSKKCQQVVILATLVIALLSACTKSYQPARDTLVVALAEQPLTLDPRFATDAPGIRIGGLIFSSFIRIGDNFEVVPEAAERWEIRGRELTFYLRPNLRFHNERPVEVDDILFTWEFYRSSTSPFSSSLKNIATVSVQKVDGQIRMDILLHQFSDSFLMGEMPIVRILPKAEVLAAGADFNQVLIGSGPFKFVSQKLNEIRLKSKSAKTENLVFKVIRDDFTRFQKMLKGEIDIAQNELPPDKIGEFVKREKDFNVITYPGLSMTYLLINFRDPLLKNLNVRQSLAESIDRANLIKYKMYDLASEATSILTPNNPYFNSEIKNLGFNPSPRKISSAPLTIKTSNSPRVIDTGRVLANQMEKTGLKVNHESFEWATYYDDVKKGNFQLALMKWVGTVDPNIYHAAFHSKETPPGRNRGAYANPALDRLLDQGMKEENINKRKKIFNEVQRLVHSDLAIIPLWYERQVAIAKRAVLDYQPTMTSDYWSFTRAYKDR